MAVPEGESLTAIVTQMESKSELELKIPTQERTLMSLL